MFMKKDRQNKRGSYFTILHEIAHAIDYNYKYDQQENLFPRLFGNNEYYSDTFLFEGETLTDKMYRDVERTIEAEIKAELNLPAYNHLSSEHKSNMINNITTNLLNQDENFEELSDIEKDLQMLIEDYFKLELDGPDNSIASDVYEGVSNFAIEGDYGHRDDYWFENGKRIREPNREGFAEYFARLMISNSNETNPGIKSVEKFLSISREHMDAMIESMSGSE